MRAAADTLLELGLRDTKMDDIATRIGQSKVILYRHFASKDDLLWEIVNDAADRFFQRLTPIVEADLNIMHKLREAIIAHVQVITDDLDAAAVYTVEWRHLSHDRRKAFTERRDAYEVLWRGMVADAIHQRFIAAPDEASATLFILSCLNYTFAWYKPDGRMTAEEVGQMLAGFVFDGLRRRTV